jgi:hypothetical protein
MQKCLTGKANLNEAENRKKKAKYRESWLKTKTSYGGRNEGCGQKTGWRLAKYRRKQQPWHGSSHDVWY